MFLGNFKMRQQQINGDSRSWNDVKDKNRRQRLLWSLSHYQ